MERMSKTKKYNMNQLNVNKFYHHFNETWWPKIEPFIASPECYEIYQQLKKREELPF